MGDFVTVTPAFIGTVPGDNTGETAYAGAAKFNANDAALAAAVNSLALSQTAGQIGFADKATMTADLAHADGTLALVTNDATPANNGTYRKTGASGSGSWVLSADRVTSLAASLPVTYLPIADATNLFNASTITDGAVVGSGGNTTPSADFYTSDFIPVEPSTQYTYSLGASEKPYAFYDASKAYIAPFASNVSTLTTPASAAFVRVSARHSDWEPATYMFVRGASLPASYQPYVAVNTERKINKNAANGYAGLDGDGKIAAKAVPFFDSRNLFDIAALTSGIYVDNTGTPQSDSGFFTTDFIPVVPLRSYKWSTTGVQKYATFYDASKEFLSGAFFVGSATAPSGSAFMRISPRSSETPAAAFMVVLGSVLPSAYQPYAGTAVECQINKGRPNGYAGLDSTGKLPIEALPPLSNPLAGKTIAGLGDSITWGFIPRNAPGYPGQLNSWLPLAAATFGANFINYGITGSTLGWNGIGSGPTANDPFTQRYSAMDDAADLIIVMGGTNDVRKGVPLGVMGDTADTTYFGALDVLCQGLLNKYRYTPGTTIGSGKQIMFMTPIKLLKLTDPNALDATLITYCAAMKQVCAFYGIPVFDAQNLSGLQTNLFRTLHGTETGYTDDYNPYVTDGTHPTQEGHQIFARALAGFIRTLY